MDMTDKTFEDTDPSTSKCKHCGYIIRYRNGIEMKNQKEAHQCNSFEEQFPSLKGKEHHVIEFKIGKVPCEVVRNGVFEELGEYIEDDLPKIPNLIRKAKNPNEFFGKTEGIINSNVISIEDIQANCLDKQKVRETIDKVADNLEKQDKLNVKDGVYIIELKKALGL